MIKASGDSFTCLPSDESHAYILAFISSFRAVSCNFRFPEIELANECSIPVFRSSHGINHGDSVNFLILSTFYFVVFAGVKAAIYLCLRRFLVLVRSFSYVIGHQATVQSSSASTAKDLAHHERLRFITESFRGGNKRESFRVF